MMLEEETRIAKEAVQQAGRFLRNREDVRVDEEKGRDIKLNADKQSESLLVNVLRETGYPILSEERGEIGGKKKDFGWIIDPLDGTANYWRGMEDLSCISVALWKGKEPVLGVVYCFSQDVLYTGIVGRGAWRNDTPIRTSEVAETGQAILMTGFPVYGDFSGDGMGKFILDARRFKKVRMLGTAARMGCLVAEGKADVYAERGIMLWDIAASAAVVKAAGGIAEIEPMGNHQCVCRLYANAGLRDNYHADSL